MIAYYAHSHGKGHLNAAYLFCTQIYKNSIIISSIVDDRFLYLNSVQIDNEDTTPDEYKNAKNNLPVYAHYLPKNNRKIVRRTKQILDAIVKFNISLALIDVSVETAIIFRIASIPYGYNLLPGERTDNAHVSAFKAADFLYTFAPQELYNNISDQYIDKCFFLGFQSRYSYTDKFCVTEEIPTLIGKSILIICGNGGTQMSLTIVKQIAMALPMCSVHSVGNLKTTTSQIPKNHLGFVKDLEKVIKVHDVVISSCGMNLTSEILALKNKFIVFAEERPYDEQRHIQKALVNHNLAVPFNINNMEDCVLKYLKLKPSSALKKWFGQRKEIERFKNKIKTYETEGHIINNHFPQEIPALI